MGNRVLPEKGLFKKVHFLETLKNAEVREVGKTKDKPTILRDSRDAYSAKDPFRNDTCKRIGTRLTLYRTPSYARLYTYIFKGVLQSLQPLADSQNSLPIILLSVKLDNSVPNLLSREPSPGFMHGAYGVAVEVHSSEHGPGASDIENVSRSSVPTLEVLIMSKLHTQGSIDWRCSCDWRCLQEDLVVGIPPKEPCGLHHYCSKPQEPLPNCFLTALL